MWLYDVLMLFISGFTFLALPCIPLHSLAFPCAPLHSLALLFSKWKWFLDLCCIFLNSQFKQQDPSIQSLKYLNKRRIDKWRKHIQELWYPTTWNPQQDKLGTCYMQHQFNILYHFASKLPPFHALIKSNNTFDAIYLMAYRPVQDTFEK